MSKHVVVFDHESQLTLWKVSRKIHPLERTSYMYHLSFPTAYMLPVWEVMTLQRNSNDSFVKNTESRRKTE